MVDEAAHIEMTQFILRQKELEKEIAKIDGKIVEWTPKYDDVKGKLAEITRIFKKVKEKYDSVRTVMDDLDSQKSKCQAEYDAIEMEKEMLKKDEQLAKAARRSVDTDQLLDHFKSMGVDPKDAEFQQQQKEMDANAALAALKEQIGDGES